MLSLSIENCRITPFLGGAHKAVVMDAFEKKNDFSEILKDHCYFHDPADIKKFNFKTLSNIGQKFAMMLHRGSSYFHALLRINKL